jgi:hypothetical protein
VASTGVTSFDVTVVYELRLDDKTEKLVEVDAPVHIGDALVLDDEVWLVLRESERRSLRARAAFACRRALRLRNQAQELVDYAQELHLHFTKVRELRPQ